MLFLENWSFLQDHFTISTFFNLHNQKDGSQAHACLWKIPKLQVFVIDEFLNT